MTVVTQQSSSAAPLTDAGLYRLVWKWHFLATLFVLPFMAMLSLTGGVYLYKDQINNWLYSDRLYISPQDTAFPIQAQIDNLNEEVGISRLHGVLVFDDPTRSTVIEFNDTDKVRSFAWINPYTKEILGVSARHEMPMQMIRHFMVNFCLERWEQSLSNYQRIGQLSYLSRDYSCGGRAVSEV